MLLETFKRKKVEMNPQTKKKFYFMEKSSSNIQEGVNLQREVYAYGSSNISLKNRISTSWYLVEIEASKYEPLSNVRDKETQDSMFILPQGGIVTKIITPE